MLFVNLFGTVSIIHGNGQLNEIRALRMRVAIRRLLEFDKSVLLFVSRFLRRERLLPDQQKELT